MKAELQNELVRKYPKFFEYLKKHDGPIIPIQFGFECGDGWYWLLDNLMNSIYNYCENNKKEVPGITQIKEKYGYLCFYYFGGDNLIDGMVWFAEHLSSHICEECGSTDAETFEHHGWYYTRCTECKEKIINN